MGETAEYQRLQETSESDGRCVTADDEEVELFSLFIMSPIAARQCSVLSKIGQK